MLTRKLIAATICTALLTAPAVAQEWSSAQLEVWEFIQSQWEADKEKDLSWAEQQLHAQFQGWGNDHPAPRGKASTAAWARYGSENETTLMQELTPLAIVVVGDTAVAHYYYTVASANRKSERETVHGRYTDVLIKEGRDWRFLAWHGGEQPQDH